MAFSLNSWWESNCWVKATLAQCRDHLMHLDVSLYQLSLHWVSVAFTHLFWYHPKLSKKSKFTRFLKKMWQLKEHWKPEAEMILRRLFLSIEFSIQMMKRVLWNCEKLQYIWSRHEFCTYFLDCSSDVLHLD